jgi:hypothetical protein
LEGLGGEDRADPRPEILRREILSGDIAHVLVHVRRVDVLDVAIVIEILE